ncbi:MAG: hypothetical protein WBZ19_22695, partial [Chthoniobacterales bacterium]
MMKGVRVDPVKRTARVSGGCTWAMLIMRRMLSGWRQGFSPGSGSIAASRQNAMSLTPPNYLAFPFVSPPV